MKRIALVLFVLILAGCSSLDQQFVSAVDVACQQILPEYERYIDADASLNDSSKSIRKRTSSLLRRLIDEAKAHGE